jgi:hypothetical protein
VFQHYLPVLDAAGMMLLYAQPKCLASHAGWTFHNNSMMASKLSNPRLLEAMRRIVPGMDEEATMKDVR